MNIWSIFPCYQKHSKKILAYIHTMVTSTEISWHSIKHSTNEQPTTLHAEVSCWCPSCLGPVMWGSALSCSGSLPFSTPSYTSMAYSCQFVAFVEIFSCQSIPSFSPVPCACTYFEFNFWLLYWCVYEYWHFFFGQMKKNRLKSF